MRVVQETTVWEDAIPNHTYFLSDDRSKMFAYVKAGSNAVFKFSKPLRFETKGRKFVEVDNVWGFAEDRPANPSWKIAGSKGSEYTVEQTNKGYTCTCSGFKFRSHCKHIDQVKEQQ